MMPKTLQNEERAKWANDKPEEFAEQEKRLADFKSKAKKGVGGTTTGTACVHSCVCSDRITFSSPSIVRVGGLGLDILPMCAALVTRGWTVIDIEGDESENNVPDALEIIRHVSDARLPWVVWVDSDNWPPTDRSLSDGLYVCRVAMASGGDVAWAGAKASAVWQNVLVYDAVNEWSGMQGLVSSCSQCASRGSIVVFTTMSDLDTTSDRHLATLSPELIPPSSHDHAEEEPVGSLGADEGGQGCAQRGCPRRCRASGFSDGGQPSATVRPSVVCGAVW